MDGITPGASLIMALILLPFCFAVAYSFYNDLKFKPLYRSGPCFTAQFAVSVVLLPVGLAFFFYALPAALYTPEDPSIRQFMACPVIVGLLSFAYMYRIAAKLLDEGRERYYMTLAFTMLSGIISQLITAIPWFMKLPVPWTLVQITKLIPFCIIVYVEYLFIRTNGTVFPKDPK